MTKKRIADTHVCVEMMDGWPQREERSQYWTRFSSQKLKQPKNAKRQQQPAATILTRISRKQASIVIRRPLCVCLMDKSRKSEKCRKRRENLTGGQMREKWEREREDLYLPGTSFPESGRAALAKMALFATPPFVFWHAAMRLWKIGLCQSLCRKREKRITFSTMAETATIHSMQQQQ